MTEFEKKKWNRGRKSAYKALTPVQVAKVLAELTGLTQLETRFIYEAVCGLIFHELVQERPFKILGVGALTPIIIDNHKYYDLNLDEWLISPKWPRVTFKMGNDIRKKYREKYPSA